MSDSLKLRAFAHNDISIIASNADNWYNNGKDTFPDRDLDGKDDRAEAAGAGALSVLLQAVLSAFSRSWSNGHSRSWTSCCGPAG